MSDQSNTPANKKYESYESKLARLTALLSQFKSKPSVREIFDLAHKQGFGPINKSMLADLRRRMWPGTERERKAISKYPVVEASGDGPRLCHYCGFDDNRVKVVHHVSADIIKRRRRCERCGGMWYTVERKGPCEPNYENRRRKAIRRKEKQCTKCKRVLPVEQFGKKDSIFHLSACRECNNRDRAEAHTRQLLREFGLTQEQYEEILKRQGGGCAICGGTSGKVGICIKLHAPLTFDHCHATNTFRGLLCHRCNRALGLLGDSLENLERAVAYLLAHRERGKESGLLFPFWN